MFKKIILSIIISIIAGGLLGYQQIQTLPSEMIISLTKQFGSVQNLVFITIIQTVILTTIATIIGSFLGRKTNLNKRFVINKKMIINTLIIAFISAFSITIPEKLFFVKALGLPDSFSFSLLYFASSLLYGGIIEEILLRYGVMTFVVFIIQKIVHKSDENSKYVASIIFASILFSLGHLPATIQLFGYNQIAIIRGIILNFIPGIGFGYLYWKYGIGYAILGHMFTHIINQLFLFSLFF